MEPDMLVKLYENLPDAREWRDRVEKLGVVIRRPIGPEKDRVAAWVAKHFRESWASEAACAFANWPRSAFLAIRPGKDERTGELVGFACYDATALGFFGPTGVLEEERCQGIGTALLLTTLEAMRDNGYGYAIIGGACKIDFYKHACNATIIPDSDPGLYRHHLRG